MNVADSGEIGKAYWTQYTAVMLIILTFVIGTFSHASYVREVANKAKAINSPKDFGEIEVNSENVSVLQGVAQVLQQHDINAALTCKGSESSCEILLQSALTQLASSGAPEDALTTEWVKVASPNSTLKVRFLEGG